MTFRFSILALSTSALAAVISAPVCAQQDSNVNEIRARIATLEAENANRAAQLDQLKAALDRIEGKPAASATAFSAATPAPASPGVAVGTPAASAAAAGEASNPLQFSGDVRVRYEQNWGDNRRDRGRGVVRGRLRATYAFDETFSVGARIVTGDPDDPNSADITLTQFDDDLLVGLDQLFGKVTLGSLELYGGKFDVPFVRTDLVWDGDVNPQGFAAVVSQPLGDAFKLRGSALYFLIDEGPATRDSVMTGGQLSLSGKLDAWQVELAGGYYDYTLPSLVGADAGDFRSNLVGPDGRYRSDFNLYDVVGSVTFTGFGAKLPVRLVGDYVHNSGAAVADDDGFSADIFVGRASQLGDWRIQYGYAEMGVDAVFAAFSHDNTDLATNYIQHTAALDYVPAPRIVLNATYYRYRPRNALYGGPIAADRWSNRLRLNLIYGF